MIVLFIIAAAAIGVGVACISFGFLAAPLLSHAACTASWDDGEQTIIRAGPDLCCPILRSWRRRSRRHISRALSSRFDKRLPADFSPAHDRRCPPASTSAHTAASPPFFRSPSLFPSLALSLYLSPSLSRTHKHTPAAAVPHHRREVAHRVQHRPRRHHAVRAVTTRSAQQLGRTRQPRWHAI